MKITTPSGRSLLAGLMACGLLASACASTSNAPTAAGQTEADATGAKLDAALAGAHRSPENAARDQYRHPRETLTFFGLRDDMTVIELFPGAGWYTEVLAPVLRERGRLFVTAADPNGDPENYNVKRAKEMLALKEAHPQVFDRVALAIIDPPANVVFGPPGSADMVLSFRSIHGWVRNNQAEAILRAVADVLKPGGVFGLVGHRGNADSTPESGYVPEQTAIRLVEAAGLKLVETSELNANAKDTKDHPKGVWTLPPNFALGDVDRDKYAAIGESDRFTLKFVKP